MKKIVKKVSLALCALMVASCGFVVCDKLGNNVSPTNQAVQESETFESGDFKGTVIKAKAMNLAMTPMMLTGDEGEPVAQAENSFVLEATISPSNAYAKGIDWELSFVNADSDWATGKTVTDYVTITPEANNPAKATVTCTSAFGEQIKVKAVSQDNANITAECLLDYAKRFRNLSGSVDAQRTIAGTQKTTQNYSFMNITTIDVTSGGRNQTYANTFNGRYTWSTGTVTEEVTETYTLVMSEGLKQAMQAQGLTVTYTPREITPTLGLMFDKVCINNLLGISGNSTDTTKWEKLMNAIGNNTEDYDFAIRYEATTAHDSTYLLGKIKINAASMVAVTSVTLNQSTHLF